MNNALVPRDLRRHLTPDMKVALMRLLRYVVFEDNFTLIKSKADFKSGMIVGMVLNAIKDKSDAPHFKIAMMGMEIITTFEKFVSTNMDDLVDFVLPITRWLTFNNFKIVNRAMLSLESILNNMKCRSKFCLAGGITYLIN